MINRMPDEYTYEDLQKDLDFLLEKGLIEIGGITPDGQWLYRATEESMAMSDEEREAKIYEALDEQE